MRKEFFILIEVLFFLIITVIIIFVLLWRVKIGLESSVKHEARRMPKLSEEDIEKRIRQAEKVHGNRFLNGFINIFFAEGYSEYKDKLMRLYKEELARRNYSA